MPWSPWIQSDPYERGTSARYKAATQSGNTSHTAGTVEEVFAEAESDLYSTTDAVTTVYGQLAGANPGASRFESASDVGHPGTWAGGIVQTQAVAWFDTGDLELETWREWSPPELNDLTEGVDYDVRPDRTGTEDDAFIQYEDGVGQVEGWTGFTFGQITSHSSSYDPPRHATAKWRLLTPAPTVPAIPPTSGSVDAPPLVLTPDDGAPIGQILNATTTGFSSGVGVELAITGPVTDFAVLMVTDESSDVPFSAGSPGEGTYDHGWVVGSNINAAGAYVRLPRWRYWIPDLIEPPLRQSQRHDGLGRSGTPRWSGATSRQKSNRWRGHL